MNREIGMKIGLRNIGILWVLLVGSFNSWAQTEYNADGEIQDAEIVIEKDRKIELGKEIKLYEFIKWKPEMSAPVNEPSEFKWYVYDVADEPMQFKPAKATVEENQISYQHYGKAGFGNYASPLLDISLTTMDDPNQMFGINLKHESFGKGEVDDENSGSAASQINLYGALIRENIRLESALNYSLNKDYYYGYPAGTSVDKGDIKHTGNFINFDLNALDNTVDDALDYEARIYFRHYSDNFVANENTVSFEINGNYSESIFIDTEVKFSKYTDTGIDESRSYLRLNPYYRLLIDDITLDVGLSFSLQNDDLPELNSSKIFPYARASYLLTQDYTLFAQLDGGYTFNSLYDFASEVGVLNQSAGVANSERLVDFTGGIVGHPMEQLGLMASVGFQSIRYLPILVNNELDQSRIDISYDQEKSTVITLSAEAQYKINDENEVSFGVNYFGYSSDGYDQIYHRPTTEILVSGNHQIIPKLKANWNFIFMDGIVGQNLALVDSDIELDAIPKLDLALHYQLKEQWGIFFSGENLFNKNFSRYLNYPQRGIQLKAGATFRL
ncbi:MAG: hypothetical protein ABJH98_09890 [Reichenbachiella sp.]|uniref:hypothetical protein n=1 Tax=Reichenbachiella sp. TaxID=2184521 RepID=UPI0032977593